MDYSQKRSGSELSERENVNVGYKILWDSKYAEDGSCIGVQGLIEQRGNVQHSKEKGNTGANIQIGTLCIYKKLKCSHFMFAEVFMAAWWQQKIVNM